MLVDECLLWDGFAPEIPHVCGEVAFPSGNVVAVLEKMAIEGMIWWTMSLVSPSGNVVAAASCRCDSPTGMLWSFKDDPYHVVEVAPKLD